MDPDFDKLIQAAISAVIPTMLDFSVAFENIDGNFGVGEPLVTGSVGFTGAFNGMVYFYSSASFARKITCAMLHMADKEIEGNGMVNDVIGELTNMLSGHIKTKLDNQGNRCAMTPPSILRGADFTIEPVKGAIRKPVYCRCGGGAVLVEVLFKIT